MRTEEGQTHNMSLRSEKDGIEEWYCPTCGRRLLVNWQPRFEKTVLEVGDQNALHSGGKSNMPKPPSSLDEDIWLAPWIKWLEEAGFEQLWDNSDV